MKTDSKLKMMKKQATPSRAFKNTLWVELNGEFSREFPGARIAWQRVVMVPLTVFVVMIMTGTGSYAYASPDITSEHVLYPVRIGMENIEGQFHRSPEGAAAFHMKMMERRMDEGEVMFKHQFDGGYLEPIEEEMKMVLSGIQNDNIDTEAYAVIFEQFHAQQGRFGELTRTMMESGTCGGYNEDVMRNKMDHMRVHISESDLDDEDKRALLQQIELESIQN